MAWWLVASSALTGLLALLCCQQLELQGLLPFALPSHYQCWWPLQVDGCLARASSTDVNDGQLTGWNIFYHQGGNSPWIPKLHGTEGDSIETPAGCRVDQVHMVGAKSLGTVGRCLTLISFLQQMSRHAERYPTLLAGISMCDSLGARHLSIDLFSDHYL